MGKNEKAALLVGNYRNHHPRRCKDPCFSATFQGHPSTTNLPLQAGASRDPSGGSVCEAGCLPGAYTWSKASAHRRIGASAHRRIGASAHRRIGASAHRIGVHGLGYGKSPNLSSSDAFGFFGAGYCGTSGGGFFGGEGYFSPRAGLPELWSFPFPQTKTCLSADLVSCCFSVAQSESTF